MDADSPRDRVRRLAGWLDASPAELAGLVVLVLGAGAVAAVLWWTGRPVAVPAAPPVSAAQVPGDTATELVGGDTVTVHVAGAVASPGLVRLPIGARVADAVERAGGLLLDADPGVLNLARPLVDGERVDVPRLGDTAAGPAGAGDAAAAATDAEGRVDLNRATAADLEELPGVGPVLAQRILDWREENGPFTAVGQLREVSGIGESTFQALAEQVTV